jgi:2-amino-4-hydroxy-6-hydroxymethyldihydropteridine diphosphokinase
MTEHTVFVALGSNIDPARHLAAALDLLRQHDPALIASPVYRTPPQGFSAQADFFNMTVQMTTAHDAARFKAEVLAAIESDLGRVRDPNNKNAPRTIDLDIALWDHDSFSYGAKPWRVPDPDITRFAHVAVPLADLAPDYRHPDTGETLATIAARLRIDSMLRINVDFTQS